MPNLLPLAAADDLGSLLFWVLVVILPALGRLLKWLGERATGAQATSEPTQAAEPAEGAEAELDGAQMWRRLLRGELDPEPVSSDPKPSVATPRRAVPTPTRIPEPRPQTEALQPVGVASTVTAIEARAQASRLGTLKERHLSVLDDSLVPGFQDDAESGAGYDLGEAPDGAQAHRSGTLGPDATSAPRHSRRQHDREGLRNALRWSIVLAPPLAFRSFEDGETRL